MALAGLQAGLQDQWRSLRAELFPQLVLLDLSDPQLLIGQRLRNDKPEEPFWTAPVPARTCREGLPVAIDALGDFIGDLLLEHSTPGASLVVALPRQLGHWRVVSWPQGEEPVESGDDLRERQVNLGWPFSLEAGVLDVQPLDPAPGQSMGQALVVGTSDEALEAWIEVFAVAGGSLRHLIPAQACLHMALQQTLAESPADGLVALLQPASRDCQLLVWRDGVPEFERTLPLAPEKLVPALAQALGFCTSRLGAGPIRLLQGELLEAASAIEERLDLPLEMVQRGEYGSLHLAGLARLTLAR